MDLMQTLPTVTFSMWGGLPRSGRADATAYTYHRHIDPAGRQWFVADAPDAGDHVYVADRDGGGFCGDVFDFLLTTGESVHAKGPWLSNPEALFTMTGVDVRDKCMMQGVVALEEETTRGFGPAFYKGVLHWDEKPVIGHCDRIDRLAEEWAVKLGKPVYAAWRRPSGGSARYVRPPGA